MSFVFKTTHLKANNIVDRIGAYKQRDNTWFKQITQITKVFHELQQPTEENNWHNFGMEKGLKKNGPHSIRLLQSSSKCVWNYIKDRNTINPIHYTKKLRKKEKLKNATYLGRHRWITYLSNDYIQCWNVRGKINDPHWPWNYIYFDKNLKINQRKLTRYIDVYSPNNNKTVILLNKCREWKFTKKKIQFILQENNIEFKHYWTKKKLIQTLMSF